MAGESATWAGGYAVVPTGHLAMAGPNGAHCP